MVRVGAIKSTVAAWCTKGYVMSDWGATHSTSIAAGLDMQMPDARFMGSTAIMAGLAAKNVSHANIDDAVGRTLTAMFAVGVIDKFAEDPMAYDSSKHSVTPPPQQHTQSFQVVSPKGCGN